MSQIGKSHEGYGQTDYVLHVCTMIPDTELQAKKLFA